MTFKPGESGNPGGRPKEWPEVRELARAHTEAAIKRLAQIMKADDDPRASAAAATALLDRGWGRPSQPISGDEDNPLRMTVTHITREIVDASVSQPAVSQLADADSRGEDC